MQEIWGLVGVYFFYLLAFELFGADCYLTVNLVGPLIMTAILGLGAWRMVRADGKNIWTALLWFRLSTGLYFGIGTYAVFVVNNYTRLYLESFHSFFADEIYKMNVVVTLSAVLVLGAARIVILAGRRMRPRPHPGIDADRGDNKRSLARVGALFLAVGIAVTYGIKVPQDFGWTTGEWPGSILGLSRLTMLGIFMLTLWSLERARWFLPIISLIAGIEMLLQLLLFAKSGVLLTLIMFLLAFLWHKATIKRLAVCAALVTGTFVGLQPIVSYAREELQLRYGSSPQVGFGTRFAILRSFSSATTTEGPEQEHQGSLSRISYVNAATFVIRQYDIGMPGDWPQLLPAVFVPRFLWPEKPIITDVGLDIYELGTGRRSSSMGAGVFADAYWAMGWWGVALYMPIYGVILGVLTLMAARLLHEGRWIFFPVVLMALNIGFEANGAYLPVVAGGTVILAGMYAVLAVAERLLRSSRPPIIGLYRGATRTDTGRSPLRSALD